jgi:Protein of unknown function (DUF1552)
MAHTKINRRTLLQSAGVTLLLAPVVKATMGQSNAKPPQRFVSIFTPNGLNYADAGPTGGETSYDIGDYYRPLEKHKAIMTAFSGMHIGGVQFGENSEWGHRSGGMGCMTCTPDEKTGKATGPSVDQFIAQKLFDQGLAPTRRAPIFGVGASRTPTYAPVFHEAKGVVAPTETDVQAAFDSLFAGVTGTQSPSAKLIARRRSILDTAYADCKSYVPALPSEGKALLDYHCTRIRELEQELAASAPQSCTPPTAALQSIKSTPNVGSPASYQEMTDYFFKLMEVALLCDLTRVTSFTWGDDAARFNMPWLTVPVIAEVDTGERNVKDHHSHTHAGTRDTIGLFMKWYSTKIAEFIDRLATPTPSGQKLIDTTLVYQITEYGAGGPHWNGNTPMFVYGNAGGKLRNGVHLHFNNQGKEHHALMVSMIQAMGITGVNQFGHPGGGSGPMSGFTI